MNRAFTLVEVISVIGILGLLASLSVSVVGNVTQNTRKEKLLSDTKTINRAVMAYRASGGSLDSSDTADTVDGQAPYAGDLGQFKAHPGPFRWLSGSAHRAESADSIGSSKKWCPGVLG